MEVAVAYYRFGRRSRDPPGKRPLADSVVQVDDGGDRDVRARGGILERNPCTSPQLGVGELVRVLGRQRLRPSDVDVVKRLSIPTSPAFDVKHHQLCRPAFE